MINVSIQEAECNLSHYLDQVEQGDVVVVYRHNFPVAELRAVPTPSSRGPRVGGLLKGLVHWEPGAFAPMTADEVAEFDHAPLFPGPDRL